jgi:phage tail-like protein
MGLVVHSGVFEVGDNGGRRLLRFDTAGAFIGEAGGFSGPVAALAIDRAGSILIHPGDPDALVRLAPSGAYARLGSLWGGPFSNGSYRPAQRHRLRMLLDELPAAARIGLHVFRGKPGVPPPPVGSGPVPFADPGWHTIPIEPGATETLIAGEPEDEIHVGIEFRSEGRTTPTLRQIRLDFDYVTSIEDLPTIYRDKPESTDFLNRFLALFESAFEDTDTLIEELPSLVDPAATPDAFLPWLAGWLAEEVDERRSSEQQRRAITTAFARAGWRGTVEGLRAALADEVGVAVAIEEPIIQSGWWALPDENDALAAGVEQSVLGFTTALAAFEPQGAVLGASATLDAAHLIAEEQYGAPLFAEAAHRVAIRLYRGRDYSERTLAAVNAIVEREKPAHVAHHLCVVEPAMRIGFQTRIGIDSIVAAPRPADLLGVGATDPAGLRLGGEAAGRIGAGGDIGRGTRLGG